ncbi:MAG: hypothetical protein KBD78_12030 [Oligoflexales bacterium]|nr:hypothetical protein [Oligoflexales bacterium]
MHKKLFITLYIFGLLLGCKSNSSEKNGSNSETVKLWISIPKNNNAIGSAPDNFASLELATADLESNEIEVFDKKSEHKSVCEGANCPSSEHFLVKIDFENLKKAIELGWNYDDTNVLSDIVSKNDYCSLLKGKYETELLLNGGESLPGEPEPLMHWNIDFKVDGTFTETKTDFSKYGDYSCNGNIIKLDEVESGGLINKDSIILNKLKYIKTI